MLIAAIVGPGLISATADNDAGGITTYSIVGAHFGYTLLWAIFVTTFILAITQEMGARLGVVTGKGLAALIREHFGVRLTVCAMLVMMVANLGTIASEFAGIAASFELVGISKFIVVPAFALIVWLVLYKGSFKVAERVFLTFALFYLVYVVSGFAVRPDWGEALRALVAPSFSLNSAYLFALIALIGTTITPWGQFFIQSYVVDKGLSVKEYRYEKMEVFFGAFLTNLISFFIIITTANTLFRGGIRITSAYDAALALKPIAGNFAQILFAVGLFAASLLGAFILPTATSYAVCEAFGWENGFDRTWKEAKAFYGFILFLIVSGALVVLIPHISLIKIMLFAQGANGILLPVILIYLMRLVNNKEIMGHYTNNRVYNTIAWGSIIGVIGVTIVLVVSLILQ